MAKQASLPVQSNHVVIPKVEEPQTEVKSAATTVAVKTEPAMINQFSPEQPEVKQQQSTSAAALPPKKKEVGGTNNGTKICLKFENTPVVASSAAASVGLKPVNPQTSGTTGNTASPSKRQLTLKSPLMPTSAVCCTTPAGSDHIVNLTYNLPNEPSFPAPPKLQSQPGIVKQNTVKKLPFSLATLTPLPRSAMQIITTAPPPPPHQIAVQPTVPTVNQLTIPQSYDASVSPLPVQNPVDLTNPPPPPMPSSEYLAMLSPSITMVAPSMTPTVATVSTELDGLDEEMYSVPQDVPLYSPAQNLNYGSHHGQTGSGSTTTPLEDWIKQPNNLTLTSDALMASLEPATPTSIFGGPPNSSTALPSFSQATGATEAVYTTASHMQTTWDDPKSLPPIENTLDFENVDLGELPS